MPIVESVLLDREDYATLIEPFKIASRHPEDARGSRLELQDCVKRSMSKKVVAVAAWMLAVIDYHITLKRDKDFYRGVVDNLLKSNPSYHPLVTYFLFSEEGEPYYLPTFSPMQAADIGAYFSKLHLSKVDVTFLLRDKMSRLTHFATRALNGFSTLSKKEDKVGLLKQYFIAFDEKAHYLHEIILKDDAIHQFLKTAMKLSDQIEAADSKSDRLYWNHVWEDLAQIHENCTILLLEEKFYPLEVLSKVSPAVVSGIGEFLRKQKKDFFTESKSERLRILANTMGEDEWTVFLIHLTKTAEVDLGFLLSISAPEKEKNIADIIHLNPAAAVKYCIKAEKLSHFPESWRNDDWKKVFLQLDKDYTLGDEKRHPLVVLAQHLEGAGRKFAAIQCYHFYFELFPQEIQILHRADKLKEISESKIKDLVNFFEDSLQSSAADKQGPLLVHCLKILGSSSEEELKALQAEPLLNPALKGPLKMKQLSFDEACIIRKYFSVEIKKIEHFQVSLHRPKEAQSDAWVHID